MAEHAPDQWGRCGKAADDLKLCAACRAVKYCENKCQKGDWKYHNTICKLDHDLGARPTPNHRHAILLREDGSHPEYVWILDSTSGFPNLDGILGEGALGSEDRSLLVGPRSEIGKHLDHHIYAFFRDDFLDDGVSKMNGTLNAMTGVRSWRGPLVLMAFGKVTKEGDEPFVDFFVCDLGPAIKEFVEMEKRLKVQLKDRSSNFMRKAEHLKTT